MLFSVLMIANALCDQSWIRMGACPQFLCVSPAEVAFLLSADLVAAHGGEWIRVQKATSEASEDVRAVPECSAEGLCYKHATGTVYSLVAVHSAGRA